MEQKKTWLRPTQVSKEFPKDKYHFSQHLENIGDYIETNPAPFEDIERLRKAATAWSWFHKVRVLFKRYRKFNGEYILRITLVSKHRLRDYK